MTNLLIQSRFLEMLKAQAKNYTQTQIRSVFEEFLKILSAETNTYPDEKTRIRELMHAQSIMAGYSRRTVYSFASKKNALSAGVSE